MDKEKALYMIKNEKSGLAQEKPLEEGRRSPAIRVGKAREERVSQKPAPKKEEAGEPENKK